MYGTIIFDEPARAVTTITRRKNTANIGISGVMEGGSDFKGYSEMGFTTWNNWRRRRFKNLHLADADTFADVSTETKTPVPFSAGHQQSAARDRGILVN